MLNGYYGGHSIPDICACKISVLLLQDPQFPGIAVHHCSESCLEPCKMSSSLCVIYIIAESQNIFPEFIYILKGSLHGDPITFSLKVYRFVNDLALLIQIPDKSYDPFRFMVKDLFRLFSPHILKHNGQLRIQISSLMKPALYLRSCKSGLFKNFRIRQKIYQGPCIFSSAQFGKKAIFQLDHRDSSLIPVMMNVTIPADLDVQIGGQCIYHRRTYAVKTAAGFVNRSVEFSSRMEGGKYQSLRRHSFLMHPYWDPSAVIFYCGRSVRLQSHPDTGTETGQMFIHRIIYDFIY